MPEITNYVLILPATISTEQDIKWHLNAHGSVEYTFTAHSYASEDIHLLANAATKFQKLVVL